jgi:hypothetical protein
MMKRRKPAKKRKENTMSSAICSGWLVVRSQHFRGIINMGLVLLLWGDEIIMYVRVST